MQNLINWLAGWKTYVIAAGGILTAIGAYLNGSVDLTTLVQSIFAALATMSMRAAIKKAEV